MTLRKLLAEANGPIHFMGVAGSGMIALAELLLRSGQNVTGCDLQAGPVARALSRFGATVLQGHDPSHVEDAAVLVVTSAIPADHPEILRARERGIPVLKRAELLGQWIGDGRTVAVAGTHGKTTTTAMITEVLTVAGLDPTGFVGGRVPSWASNLRMGSADLFVVEADEFDRSFHQLHPHAAVVTNMEADHLDIYGDFQGVREAFVTFLDGMADGGRVAVCLDDPGSASLLSDLPGPSLSYGIAADAQLRGVEVEDEGGVTRFRVLENGEDRGVVTLRVPGLHNVRNALGAAAAARFLEVDWEAIKTGLGGFTGVGRRFQVLGEGKGVLVVDDYAHHPTEIRATISAARARYPERRVVAVFQPHLFSRTRDFAGEFGRALAEADEIWVSEIYPAREAPIPGVTGVLVAQAALDAGAQHVFFHSHLSDFPKELVPSLRPGDICLIMGAGTIEFLGPDIVAGLRKRAEGGRETR